MIDRKSFTTVDMAAYLLTGVALAAVIGAPLGLAWDVKCNPFSLADPFCTAIIWAILALVCVWLYLAIFMVKAWWSDWEASLLSRIGWLIFGLFLLPYAVVLYYWFPYRRRVHWRHHQCGADRDPPASAESLVCG